MAEPSGNLPGPPHALRMPACMTLSAARQLHFIHAAAGVVTRMQNVSKYMLVLALCLSYKGDLSEVGIRFNLHRHLLQLD